METNATDCNGGPRGLLRRAFFSDIPRNADADDGSPAPWPLPAPPGRRAPVPAAGFKPDLDFLACPPSIVSALNVFGFLRPGRDATDPLQSPRTAAAWLRELPPLDVTQRQQQVMRAFEAMRQEQKPVDPPRIHAIGFLDAALGADRRQLIKQYVENVDASPQLAERLWVALQELTQGFVYAYRTALEQSVEEAGGGRSRSLVPMLFARLIHYHGTDSKLRVFRFERWIPAKWIELHQLYSRAIALGIDRTPTTLVNAGSNATQWTIEQEYINVLLVHQLNTGNLAPAEIDWASAQLRAWSRRLALDAVPRSTEGFHVDLSGKTGLVRRTGTDSGPSLRYLDTSGLTDQLERAILALRRAQIQDEPGASTINQQRVAILERLRPSVAPNLNADLRRDPRVPVQVSARVRVGLGRICHDLATEEPVEAAADATEHIEVFPVNDGSRPRRRTYEDRDSVMASLSPFSDPMWQVKDRSIAGLRIAASGGIGQSLALGALVAVRQSDLADWVVGVVRRLNKVSNDDFEAGLSIIADRVVPVRLHARRESTGMGMEVDGLDLSTIGARFDGLYLPPPSRPEKPLNIKTLVVPTIEYVEGRRIVLTTGRSIYTVALRDLIEQRAEWSWCAMQIVEKKPRSF